MFEFEPYNIKTNILSKIEEDWGKIVAARLLTLFFIKIWPSDLLINPTLTMCKLDPGIIKTNILNKFEEDWVRNCGC